jgi:hypothetical protein
MAQSLSGAAAAPTRTSRQPLGQDGQVLVETDLLNAAGPRVFDRALAAVRDRYKRRTSLLAALDRARLRTVPETPGA